MTVVKGLKNEHWILGDNCSEGQKKKGNPVAQRNKEEGYRETEEPGELGIRETKGEELSKRGWR